MSEDITVTSEDITPPFIKTASRVCIVGFADGHRADAPFDEPDMEFWGLNRLHTVLPDKTWHRWFELHDLEKFYGQDQEHQTFLKAAQFPIYVRPQDMQIAEQWGIDAVPYPRDQIVATFQPYFTNTVSWLLAMAIMMEFEEIHLYGVDMAMDNVLQAEYAEQRPSCEWLIGLAQGRGIKVVLPPGSDLMKASHLYGFDDDEYRAKMSARVVELANRKEQIRGEMHQHKARADMLQARISELDGSMQECHYQLRNLITQSVGE